MTDLRHTKRSFENGVQFAWDSTSVSLAMACPRKYYYTMIRGIRGKRKSVHLLFGGIYASALEQFYKLRFDGQSIEDATRAVVRLALEQSWDREANAPMFFDDAKKTRVNLIRTLVWYLDQFAEESEDSMKTYQLPSGKPAVELSFALEIDDEIMLCGHLDRVVEFGGALYVMDQKTTGGTIGTYYFDGFKPDIQMSNYSYAGKAVLGSPVRGVIIDAAQVAVNFTRFERGITNRSRQELDEFIEGEKLIIKHIQELTRRDTFPMNPTACGNYGGCEFRHLCSSSPNIRENLIKTDFVEHNWDPIKAR